MRFLSPSINLIPAEIHVLSYSASYVCTHIYSTTDKTIRVKSSHELISGVTNFITLIRQCLIQLIPVPAPYPILII
jgi:hypothetical protein